MVIDRIFLSRGSVKRFKCVNDVAVDPLLHGSQGWAPGLGKCGGMFNPSRQHLIKVDGDID